jgi:hypothetical protein
MKYILHVVCVALPLMCGADNAMAVTPGLPPLSGPGSVFYGHPEKGGDALPTQKSQRKQKKSQHEAGFRSRQVLPKRSQ